MEDISTISLDPKDRMDLVILSSQPQMQALWKLMQDEVVRARDDAMAIDPAERDRQVAAMTVAHAMAKFYTRVRKALEFQIAEHIGEVKAKASEEVTKDSEYVEKCLLQQ